MSVTSKNVKIHLQLFSKERKAREEVFFFDILIFQCVPPRLKTDFMILCFQSNIYYRRIYCIKDCDGSQESHP